MDKTTRRYGGNTSCVEVQVGDRTLIFDAGSGIEPLGRSLIHRGAPSIDIFLTHAHYDHVMGLPFFAPLHSEDYPVTLHYGGSDDAPSAEALLDKLMEEPFLPFGPKDFRGDLRYAALPTPGTVQIGPDCELATHCVNHPGGSLAFKLSYAGRTFVYLPDFEHDDGPQDEALVGFLDGADLAFLDCTYTPAEYPRFRGIGHSHWERLSELARAAKVRSWGAFHHAHTRSDEELDHLADTLSHDGSGGFVVSEGSSFDLVAL